MEKFRLNVRRRCRVRELRFGRSVGYKLSKVVRWMNKPDYASTSEADEAKHDKASA
jgi:hypothetical protein